MDTSVITSCSHNFCSLCIRRYLHYKTQCPTCYKETFEKDLRKNKVLDEIITQYLNIKEKLQRKTCPEKIEAVKDKNLIVDHSNVFEERKSERKNVSDASEISHGRLDSPVLTAAPVHNVAAVSTPRGQRYQQDESSPSTSASPRIPSMFTPKSKKGFRNEENCKIVVCPVCKVDVPENNINKHLDDCLKRENIKDRPKKTGRKERKPLPKLVFSLMKDNVIRKKLKELGLSSQGDRKILENRLQRYTILYNAECDKVNPRSVSELIKQCEEEENLEKKAQKPSNRLNINRNTEHNIIDQQRKKYLTTNKESFDQLITQIKATNRPQKLPVRRDILSGKNFQVSYKDRALENDSRDGDDGRSDFQPTDFYIDDPDSHSSFNVNPMNFLRVEVSSSSDDETDQCIFTSKQDTSNAPCKNNSVALNSIIKTENIKIKSSSLENTSTYKEVASNKLKSRDTTDVSQVRKYNVSEDIMDIDIDESRVEFTRSDLENNDRVKLFAKRNRNGTSQGKHVAYLESRDKRKMESHNRDMDSITTEHDMANIDSIEDRLIHEELRHEQLHNIKEGPVRTKVEKENVESLDDINIFRKRERETTFMLNDDEGIGDRLTNVRKSARLGLSEAKGFNNEDLSDNALQIGEKSQDKREQLCSTRARNTNIFMKKSVRLRGKISSNTRNNDVS